MASTGLEWLLTMDWPRVLLRTTIVSALATGVVWGLLTQLHIRSPRVHRLAWLLVVAQGWLFFAWTLELPILSERTPAMETVASNHSTLGSKISHEIFPSGSKVPESVERPWFESWGLMLWAVGAIVVVCRYARGFFMVLYRLPLGQPPDRQAWQAEWNQVVQAAKPDKKVHLRITQDLGPLLCFVPFSYLVLAPKQLWSSLASQQRKAILSHELAHLARRDLWKSVAIRALALPQWFNPFVWFAVKRFEEAAEWACDDLASGASNSANSIYAKALIRVAEFSRNRSSRPSLSNSVAAEGGVLSRRISRLVHPRFMEESKMKRMLVPALLIVLTVAQLVRVELVAAKNTTPKPTEKPVAALVEPTPANILPYVIEPPDILHVQATDMNKQCLVGPDGKIDLKSHGQLFVAGMTVAQAQQAIKKRLSDTLKNPKALVDVIGYNSKAVYLITNNSHGEGENVHRIPLGPDTRVREVLASATWPNPIDLRDCSIRILRPSPNSMGKETVLPVDWSEVIDKRNLSSNHLLQPGDRIFVESKEALVAPTPPVQKPYAIAGQGGRMKNQILIRAVVIEDLTGSLAEFETLESRGFMQADSDSISGMLRILKKNGLVTVLADPTLVILEGGNASICAAGQPSQEASDALAEFDFSVGCRILNEKFLALNIESKLTRTNGRVWSVDSLIESNSRETVLLKAIPSPLTAQGRTKLQAGTAIYIAITPELQLPPQSSENAGLQNLSPKAREPLQVAPHPVDNSFENSHIGPINTEIRR